MAEHIVVAVYPSRTEPLTRHATWQEAEAMRRLVVARQLRRAGPHARIEVREQGRNTGCAGA